VTADDVTGPGPGGGAGLPSSDGSAGRREWIALAVLALPTLLISVDLSVLHLALPHLSADLQPTGTQTLWILDMYGFMLAGFLVTMGTLGDRIGRRRLLLTGATGFAIASAVAAYATGPGMLIAARALMGVAGATLAPSGLALVGNMFRDPRQRAVAVAVWMSCFQGGMAIGPLVGGALLESFWWGSVFLLGVPVMAVLLAVGPALLPEYRDPAAGRLDLTSVALSLAAILPVTYGLKELARNGWQPLPVVALGAGLVFGLLFGLRQLRLASPLLDLRLFSNRSFSAGLAVFGIPGIIGGGAFLMINLYLQMVAGLEPLQAGLLLAPASLAMVVGSMLAPALARRFRPAHVMATGLLVAAAGYLLLIQVDPNSGLTLAVVGNVLSLLGVAPMTALVPDMIIGSAPPEKTGSAVSILQTSGELGIALGVATLGTVGTAVYRAQIVDSIPAGVPTSAADAARESIANAVASARDLPGPVADSLVEVAGTAFTSGLHVVAGIAAAGTVACAALALAAFRHRRPSGEVSPEPDAGEAFAEPEIEPSAAR
jgi:DHA2 family multidrug resistance protein-like MFS transporter